MSHPHNEAPVNPLPPVVVALFLLIAGIELVFALGERGILGGAQGVGWRLGALQKYAFSGEVLNWMLTTGQWPFEHVMRFVTYPFVHATFTHALFAGAMLLALGKMVAEAIGGVQTLAIFVVSGIGGALAFGLLMQEGQPLYGAFPPVYGLIGAFTYLLWVRLGQMGEHQIRAFSMIGILLFIQLLFGLLFGAGNDWIADVAGFLAGFVLATVLIPGGWARLRSYLRRD